MGQPESDAPEITLNDDQDLILRVHDLRTHFQSREGTLRAVDGMSFDIRRGETVGIVGESGCGKSVTAQSILRILPSNGAIETGTILFRTKEARWWIWRGSILTERRCAGYRARRSP